MLPVFEVNGEISVYCSGRACRHHGAAAAGCGGKSQMILASHRGCLLEVEL